MTTKTAIQGLTARLTKSGRFDFLAQREFKAAYTLLIEDATVNKIEVEMSKIDYLDSSALGMLILLRRSAHETNKTIVLLNPSVKARRVLEVANFNRLFNISHAN